MELWILLSFCKARDITPKAAFPHS